MSELVDLNDLPTDLTVADIGRSWIVAGFRYTWRVDNRGGFYEWWRVCDCGGRLTAKPDWDLPSWPLICDDCGQCCGEVGHVA